MELELRHNQFPVTDPTQEEQDEQKMNHHQHKQEVPTRKSESQKVRKSERQRKPNLRYDGYIHTAVGGDNNGKGTESNNENELIMT